MTDKELAEYVLTHNLNEIVKLCNEIINKEEKTDNKITETKQVSISDASIYDIPNISRKMTFHLRKLFYEKVSDLLDKEHIKKFGRWWYLRGIGKESLMPVMIYLYQNKLIKNENTIDPSFFEMFQCCIHNYLSEVSLAEPKIINFDLNENERLMSLDLVNTKLPKRGITVLKKHNVNTIGKLLKLSNSELRRIPQLGWKTYNDIKKSLKENYGFELKDF